MKICPNCGTKNSDSAKHCNFCDATFPQAESPQKRETNYTHDSQTEKKKANKRKFLIALSAILVFCALLGILKIVFSGDKTSKSEELVTILSNAITEEGKFSGSLKTDSAEIIFEATVTKNSITVLMNGGKYDSMFISKEGMVLEIHRQDERNTINVTPDMEEYKLYVAYLLATAVDFPPLAVKTEDIENKILPIVKDHIITDFDKKFIKDNFTSGISSLFLTLENDNRLDKLFGMKLPSDVKNSEIAFNISSYDLQNHVLGQFKKSYINAEDYDEINDVLKGAKSKVNKNYKADGTLTTENGKLKSAKANIVYSGRAYTLNIDFN